VDEAQEQVLSQRRALPTTSTPISTIAGSRSSGCESKRRSKIRQPLWSTTSGRRSSKRTTFRQPNFLSASSVDWGTGLTESDLVMARLTTHNPAYLIHLGDVYYAGTKKEERGPFFLAHWPTTPEGRSFTLNSNHEMYSGGHGYFNVALADTRFKAQCGTSYFRVGDGSLRHHRL